MKIELENMKNTRDLGGMTGDRGRRIKKGKLIRSGHLWGASENDIKTLFDYGVRHIVDFRTDQEVTDHPDPQIDGVKYNHWPALSNRRLGVTLEKGAEKELAETMDYFLATPGQARKDMIDLYRIFIEEEAGINAYKNFLTMLSKEPQGAVLWHCSFGKDRAGTATMLILETLGVSKEDIIADYLTTNDNIGERMDIYTEHITSVRPHPKTAAVVRDLLCADADYINNIYDIVQNKYGDMKGYITEVLGITLTQQENIRNYFLED